jgi:WD40 repeat protein
VGRAERLWRWCRRNPAVATLTATSAALLVALSVASTVGYLRTTDALREAERGRAATARALDEARRERAATREQLWKLLTEQGRTERLAGSRWGAIEAFGKAARIRPSEELRQEAIQALSSPGVRQRHAMPFGGIATVIRLSSDGGLVAAAGIRSHTPKDRAAVHYQIVVYRMSDGRPIDQIEGGKDLSRFLDFQPGSSTLIFGDEREGQAGLWLRDVVRGKDVGFVPSAGTPISCRFSPDGARIALMLADRIRVIRADNLREEWSRPSAFAIKFTASDELLTLEGRQLRGWDVSKDVQTFAFDIPRGKSPLPYDLDTDTSRSVLPLVDSSSKEQPVTIWDVRTGKELARINEAARGVSPLRQTAPGSLLAFDVRTRPGEILLYDLVRQAPLGRLDGVISAGANRNPEERSSLSPDGRLLAAYAGDVGSAMAGDTINVWDVQTGQKVASLRNCMVPVWSLDGQSLVTIAGGAAATGDQSPSVSPGGVINVWEVADPAPTYRQQRSIESISSSPDGRRLAVDDLLWELTPGARPPRLRPLPRTVPADLVAFTRAGALYAARLRRQDIPTTFEQPAPFWQLEPEPREFGFATAEKVKGVSYANDGKHAAFSPDSRFAAVIWRCLKINGKASSRAGDPVDLWDLMATKQVRLLLGRSSGQPDPVGGKAVLPGSAGHPFLGMDPRQAVFSADSRKLAIALDPGVVIFGVPECVPLRWLKSDDHGWGSLSATHCVAITADGRWVCYGGAGGRLDIGSLAPEPGEAAARPFDPASATAAKFPKTAPRVRWKGHTGTVLTVAISADGRILASGGEDRMIRLWEIPSGRPLAHWEAHDANVTALAFQPDGRTLISGAANGMLRLWDLPSIRRELAALGLDW